ncbi:CRISPR system precrRNA processing endoribonuclease RAMP protein Cas6 [Haloarchaeobius amylolyticus]|uniref:CRISPR system precrRNA processing endoribonuclease RAMP protein Cas6 n=1 Tax=Haloarchaeobius amylolyticus TaxID=1198296 RepID=UPI00226F7B00|nr:CRISPR system precrRNA processing endoribonuclease RAMP protein Cas6 [Haloarchaeobius amylolyticus]
MATSSESGHESTTLRRVQIKLAPDSRFSVPNSDGYSLYSAVLSSIDAMDETVSQQVHDSDLGSLHVSALRGVFADSDRPHHKTILPNNRYTATIGVTDPSDARVFQTLVRGLVLENDEISLTNGSLHVREFENSNTNHTELLEEAGSLDEPRLTFDFQSPTCIEEAGSVTTMFPHRVSVFRSLLGKWNRTAPDDLNLEFDRDALARSVIEKPDASSYDTHSVLVNRVSDDDDNPRPIFRQGFTGTCTYAFKDASESLQNAVTAVSLFAEYSGVGSAVARGCGDVTVEAIQ